MHAALRPYAAGLAVVGANLIALAPVAAPLPALPPAHTLAVQLTGAFEDVVNTASDNATTLLNNYYLAPGVAFQQFLANQADYWDQLLNGGASSTHDVFEDFQQHLNAVLSGFALQDTTSDVQTSVIHHTIDGGLTSGHAAMFGQIASYLPPDTDPATVMPIINFLASPESGIIMGMLGPGISPWIALMNSITDGDSFSDTLTNMVGGFFNGATLNLDALLPMINGLGVFPAGMTMEHLDFAFGGLLSTGDVTAGPWEVMGSGDEIVASVAAVGGSIFNSVGLSFSGVPVLGTLDVASQAIGPIGAWLGWGRPLGHYWARAGTAPVPPSL